jgi:hypothetical protein
LLFVPTQAYAVTLFEFAIANAPDDYVNATYSVRDWKLDQDYKWLEVNDKGPGYNDKYALLPDGVAEAWSDPAVEAAELEADYGSP